MYDPISRHFRALFLATTFVLCLAPSVGAQPNWRIDAYADAQMSACSFTYTAPALLTLHIFISGDTPITGVRFALYPPPCLTGATWIGDNPILLGARAFDTQHANGLHIVFDCHPTPAYVASVFFVVSDPSVQCCTFGVSTPTNPDEFLAATDCHEPVPRLFPVTVGQGVVINPDAECACDLPVATEQTTWGKIKSLYR